MASRLSPQQFSTVSPLTLANSKLRAKDTKIRKLQETINARECENNDLEREVNDLKRTNERLLKKIDFLSSERRADDDVRDANVTLQECLAEAESKLKDTKDFLNEKRKMLEIKMEHIEFLETEIEMLEVRKDELERCIKEKDEGIRHMKDELDTLDSELQSAKKECSQKEQQSRSVIKELENQLDEANKVRSINKETASAKIWDLEEELTSSYNGAHELSGKLNLAQYAIQNLMDEKARHNCTADGMNESLQGSEPLCSEGSIQASLKECGNSTAGIDAKLDDVHEKQSAKTTLTRQCSKLSSSISILNVHSLPVPDDEDNCLYCKSMNRSRSVVFNIFMSPQVPTTPSHDNQFDNPIKKVGSSIKVTSKICKAF